MTTKRYKLAQLGAVVTGATPPTKQEALFGDAYPFITPSDIDEGAPHVQTARGVSEEGKRKFSTRILPPRAVCYTCIASIGKICITDRPALTNQQINSIVVDESVCDPRYLYYLLRVETPRIQAMASGVATPIINKTDFSEIEVELPPVGVQRSVGRFLWEYEQLIENNTRRIAILEDMAQAIYREWFVNFRFPGHEQVNLEETALGLVPVGWAVVRIDEALTFQSGKTIGKEDRGGSHVPVYGANGIIGHTDRNPVHPPCTILGKIGSCGSLHRAFVPCWVTNNAFSVVPNRVRSPEMVWHMLGQVNWKPYIGGSANPYMPENAFGHHLVVVAPEGLQMQFQDLLQPISAMQNVLRRQSAVLSSTRDVLLPKLVSCEIELAAMEKELAGVGA